MTTGELRKKDFELVVAPNAAGEAFGQLYYDDGESITPESSTLLKFTFKNQTLTMSGDFGYPLGVNLAAVRILGVQQAPKEVLVDGKGIQLTHNQTALSVDAKIGQPFTKLFEVSYRS
jgi:alpha-glucosidase